MTVRLPLKPIRQLLGTLYPRVGTRVVTPFLLAIIIIAGISAFTVTNLVTGSIQERFKNQLFESGNAASNALYELEREMLESLRSMVFTVGVVEALRAADAEALHALLYPIAANDGVEEVIVFTADGSGVYRLLRAGDETGIRYEQTLPLAVRDWRGAQRVMAGESDAIGDKFADLVERDGSTMLFISAPVQMQEPGMSEVIGGIAIGYDTATLVQRSAAQALSSVAMLARDGRLLGSTFRVEDTSPLALPGDAARQRLEQVDDSSPVVEMTLDDAGYQVLYAPYRVRGEAYGLLVVGLPSSYIVEQSGVSRNVVALLFGGLFVVVALVGIWVARSIIHPVTMLVDTTRAIMGGDLQRRVHPKGHDELSELGHSVDAMTDDLVQRNLQIADLYQAQLHVTAQREAVFANISDAVIVQDETGSIIQMNVAAFRLIDAVSRKPWEKEEFDTLLVTSDDPTTQEASLVELAGGFYSVRKARVNMPDGVIIGHVTTFTDLSALIRSERLKDELILQMSHELRTPLAALRGNVDLIRLIEKKNLSEKGVGFLQRSTDHLEVLERLLNQVVDVSSILTNRFYIDNRLLDLSALAKKQASRWLPLFADRNLTLELVLPDEPLCISGDAERLEQVIDHLLRNAHSYTLAGGACLEVTASVGEVLLMIADTGVGIKQSEIDQIFERMYRGSAAHAGPTDSRGMGLGLYLTKYIVELHQGSITVDSCEGEGTRVTVRLPVASALVVEAA